MISFQERIGLPILLLCGDFFETLAGRFLVVVIIDRSGESSNTDPIEVSDSKFPHLLASVGVKVAGAL